MRLKVESTDVESVPDWSIPQLTIQARANSVTTREKWIDRIQRSDRVNHLVLDDDESTNGPVRMDQDGMLSLELTGAPIATRVLP